MRGLGRTLNKTSRAGFRCDMGRHVLGAAAAAPQRKARTYSGAAHITGLEIDIGPAQAAQFR